MNDNVKLGLAAVGVLAVIGIGAGVVLRGGGSGSAPDEVASKVVEEPGKSGKAKRGKRGGKGADEKKGLGVDDNGNSAVGKPNVLIILWDTTRADRLTIYNEDLPTTPKMAEWAKTGVVFERAISPGMWTVPSHASMFTGLPPTTHGAGEEHRWLDKHFDTIAEVLGSQGYDTYAFSANPNLSPDRVNLLQGVEDIDVSWGGRWKKKVVANARKKQIKSDKSTEISPSYAEKLIGEKPVMTYNAAPVTHEAFVGWLDRRESKEPWYAYLSYMEAHKPRIPALESRKVVADEETIKLGLATDLSFKNQLVYSYGKMEYTDKELEAINRVYDATLVDLDHDTAAMLADMKAKGYLDNTIVIFTADHGELLGEHHLFGHRNSVYQALLHVPLVISYPGHLDPKRVEEEVSNLDIYNTILELTGVPKPTHNFSKGNLTTKPNTSMGVFAEMESVDKLGWNKVSKLFSDLERGPWLRKYRSIIHEGWKVIRDTEGDLELYHVHEDPHEEKDLAGSNAKKLAELVAVLDAYEAQLEPYDATKREEGEGEEEDSDEMKKQLLLLGYAEEDEPSEDEGEDEGDEGSPAPE